MYILNEVKIRILIWKFVFWQHRFYSGWFLRRLFNSRTGKIVNNDLLCNKNNCCVLIALLNSWQSYIIFEE